MSTYSITRRSYCVALVAAPLVVRGASGTSNPGGFGAVAASPNPGNPPFELPPEEPDDPDDPDEELEDPPNPDRPPPNPPPLDDEDAGADDGFDDELAEGLDDELVDPPALFAASRAARTSAGTTEFVVSSQSALTLLWSTFCC